MTRRAFVLFLAVILGGAARGEELDPQLRSAYVLGPEDQITVWALDVEEIQ